MRFLRPDLYLAVLQPEKSDFKASALRYLDRADALFVPGGPGALNCASWPGVSAALLRNKPIFALQETALDAEAFAWLSLRLGTLTSLPVTTGTL